MDPLVSGLIGVVIMLILLFLSVPVGFTMGLIGFLGVIFLSNTTAALNQAAIIPYQLISNYNYCVLPLFILMANVCFYSGMGAKIFDIVYRWVGRLPGGLAAAAIGACTLFGAVSASIIATALTIGLVSLPEMKKYRYDGALSAATVAAASVLGILIPPSGTLIIYGILTETSIGDLFIAGIVPGLALMFMFMIQVVITGMIKPDIAPAGRSFSIKEKFSVFGSSIEVIILIVFVIGGLMVGWFTPTEAGGIGAFGAIVFALIRRSLSKENFKKAVLETLNGSGMIYVMLIGAFIFNTFLALSTIPQELASIVAGFNLPPLAVILLILLVYLFLGCIIDALPMILLTVPVFFPVIVNLGYDPIWFGIIIVLVSGMGVITPPMGMAVFVVAGIAKKDNIPMGKIFKHACVFLGTEVIFTILLIIFPQIATFLPNLI